MSEATAFAFEPGVRQERVEPSEWTPPHGSWAFCLGSDGNEERITLREHDYAEVWQDVSLPPGVNVLRFVSRFIVPEDLPTVLAIVGDLVKRPAGSPNANALQVAKGATITYDGDGNPISCGALGRECDVSGSGLGNDGRYVVIGYEAAPIGGSHEWLILEQHGAAEEVGLTVNFPALVWVAELCVDGVPMATMREVYARTRDRLDMAANISKLAGVHRIAFRLRLETA